MAKDSTIKAKDKDLTFKAKAKDNNTGLFYMYTRTY